MRTIGFKTIKLKRKIKINLKQIKLRIIITTKIVLKITLMEITNKV